MLKRYRSNLYWKWRFSSISKPFYSILNWIDLIVNARKTAIALDNTMRVMGKMQHIDYRCPNTSCENCKKVRISDDRMSMSLDDRARLISEGYKSLPDRKWRNK